MVVATGEGAVVAGCSLTETWRCFDASYLTMLHAVLHHSQGSATHLRLHGTSIAFAAVDHGATTEPS